MPFPLKTAETASDSRGLSLFTEAEVNRSVITRADTIFSITENLSGAKFEFWILKIKDHYRNEYEYNNISKGCKSIKTPISIIAVERFSQKLLLKYFCIKVFSFILFSHCSKRNTSQQMFS